MVSGIPPLGVTQIERFLSCDTVLLGVRYNGVSDVLHTVRATDSKVMNWC
jgi:hypothetical protein